MQGPHDARRRMLVASALLLGLAGTVALADQLVADDEIVQGGACIGLDCVNGESFGDDVFRLKENNLRIRFIDESLAPAPANDWRITANDSRNGGASQLSIDDMDALPTPFGPGIDVTSDAGATLAIALGDFDNDFSLDLVAGNDAQPNRLYMSDPSDPNGPFAGASGSDISADSNATLALAIGDLNGDFAPDVVAGNLDQANRFYLNNGSATPFAPVVSGDVTTDAHATTAIAVLDLNAAGGADVIVGNAGQPNRIYLNNGAASFVGSDLTADSHETTSIAVGDVNQDGRPDVVVGNFGQPNRLYLNNLTASPFAGVTGVDISSDSDPTAAIGLADVDGDTLLDVIVGNEGTRNRVYLNGGGIDPFGAAVGMDIGIESETTTSLELSDVNADGEIDVIVGNAGQANRVYLNDGSATPFQGAVGIPIGTSGLTTTSLAASGVGRFGQFIPSADLLVGNDGQTNQLHPPLDGDGGTSPVVFAANAPDHALYVDLQGRVGLGTSTPDPNSLLDVAGDLRVDGDLEITGGARAGIVPVTDFDPKSKQATVSFPSPYPRDYVIVLTPVGATDTAKLQPFVSARDATGFTISAGGSLKKLQEVHWVTRWAGEF